MSFGNPSIIEIKNFTTFMNDNMETIVATDRKMHITEIDVPVNGVLAPMNDEGCFVVEVSIGTDRLTEGQLDKYPNGIRYLFVSEDPIIAPGVDAFILFWASETHAHAVEVAIGK